MLVNFSFYKGCKTKNKKIPLKKTPSLPLTHKSFFLIIANSCRRFLSAPLRQKVKLPSSIHTNESLPSLEDLQEALGRGWQRRSVGRSASSRLHLAHGNPRSQERPPVLLPLVMASKGLIRCFLGAGHELIGVHATTYITLIYKLNCNLLLCFLTEFALNIYLHAYFTVFSLIIAFLKKVALMSLRA